MDFVFLEKKLEGEFQTAKFRWNYCQRVLAWRCSQKHFCPSLEGNNPGDVQVYLGTENEYLVVMPLEGHNEFFSY